MQVWAIANQKGGVGKTTVTVCLAGALAELGRRVLVVDVDGFSGAGAWLLPDAAAGDDDRKGTAGVLLHRVPLASNATSTSIAGIDCVPGSAALALAPGRLQRATDAEFRLRQAVAELPPDRWDWVLIDCAPTLGLLMLNALGAARRLLVPIAPDFLAVQGLGSLAETVETARATAFNPELEIGAVVVNNYRRSRLAGEVEALVRDRFGRAVLKTRIRQTVRLAEAPSWQQPITSYAPRHPAADDFRSLARELERRISSRKGTRR